MDENTQQTDTGQQTQTQEQVDDWNGASADFLADKGIDPAKVLGKQEGESDEQKQTTEGSQTQETDSKYKKSDEEQGAGDDSKKDSESEEKTDPNDDENLEQQDDAGAASREARALQRQIQQDNKEVQADVKKELYPDWNDDILDDQGKPMKTPRDVMNHINPNTGKRFTEEEATAWLFAAQEYKDNQRKEMIERVEHVADVMITQRDDADYIRGKFGKLLGQLPELRKEIWADYKATLVVDDKSGLIIDAPVSLKRFFERALKPYATYAARLEAEASNNTGQQTEQKPPAKTDAEVRQTQADREDITSTGTGSTMDPEEEGWANAAKQYYEGK